MCIQSALKLGKKEIEVAEELWKKARALVGGTSGEKSLEAAKQFMEGYESMLGAAPHQAAPPPSGAGLEAKVSGMLEKFSGSLEKVMQSSLRKVADLTNPGPEDVSEPKEYQPPSGSMVVSFKDQLELASEKKSLEKELALRKEFAAQAKSERAAKDSEQNQAVASLARIAESKNEKQTDQFETFEKMFGLMNKMQDTRALPAPDARTLTVGGSAAPPPPPPARTESDLPPGWEAIQCPDGVYYCNRQTNASQYVWTRVRTHTTPLLHIHDPTFLCNGLTDGTTPISIRLFFHLPHHHRLPRPEDRRLQGRAPR